ncbi:hypothetical protein AB1Y20_011228 [Prymnesium parvum]|uniref:Uncharacterized protein n=1 Tax=Prymnesium parvum TaxID=97485 RepID=A0AB34INY3_PRYPA
MLAEVSGISREMAQLQELAAQLSERSAEGVVTAGGARRRPGSRATPACAPDGVDLEQALAGLDVDAMLASLEAEHQPSLDELDD